MKFWILILKPKNFCCSLTKNKQQHKKMVMPKYSEIPHGIKCSLCCTNTVFESRVRLHRIRRSSHWKGLPSACFVLVLFLLKKGFIKHFQTFLFFSHNTSSSNLGALRWSDTKMSSLRHTHKPLCCFCYSNIPLFLSYSHSMLNTTTWF